MLRAARLLALASVTLAIYDLQANANEIANPLLPFETRLSELYQQHKDAVVKVKVATQTRDKNGKDQVALTVLSGFYIDDQGTVLTNAVPLQEGPRIRIEKDGLQLLAVPLASDPRSNLGLVRVAKPPADIHFIDIQLKAVAPKIGSIAYAITSPLDFAPTPKLGLVSGRESSFTDIEFPFTYTRVSIASGPAEGGSPVFDSNGSLIGVSVASLPDVNSSYIVPTLALQRIVEQLRKSKTYPHPIIKAHFSEQVDPTSLNRSIVVTEVQPASTAAKSGLLAGDHILKYQGNPVSRLDALRDAIFYSEAGQFATLFVRRKDKEIEIALLLDSE